MTTHHPRTEWAAGQRRRLRVVVAAASGVLVATGLSAHGTDATAPTAAAVLHVSPTGSDSGSGTARDPLRTPQVAVDRLGAGGGVIEFADGTYARTRVVLRDRTDVTLRAAGGARPELDASGLEPPDGESALIEIRGGRGITVEGLSLTGYRTTSLAKVPEGILVTGAASDVSILDNRVHHLGNDNPTRGSFDINAHGIAVIGRNAGRPVTGVVISDNEVDHLVLGPARRSWSTATWTAGR